MERYCARFVSSCSQPRREGMSSNQNPIIYASSDLEAWAVALSHGVNYFSHIMQAGRGIDRLQIEVFHDSERVLPVGFTENLNQIIGLIQENAPDRIKRMRFFFRRCIAGDSQDKDIIEFIFV